MAVISVFFLIAAILVFCLKTHPGLRVYEIEEVGFNQTSSEVISDMTPIKPSFKYQTKAIGIDKKASKPHPSFLVSHNVQDRYLKKIHVVLIEGFR